MSGPAPRCGKPTGHGPCIRPPGHDDDCLQPPADSAEFIARPQSVRDVAAAGAHVELDGIAIEPGPTRGSAVIRLDANVARTIVLGLEAAAEGADGTAHRVTAAAWRALATAIDTGRYPEVTVPGVTS